MIEMYESSGTGPGREPEVLGGAGGGVGGGVGGGGCDPNRTALIHRTC